MHQALRSHRAGRTSLLISHRLAALREADLIVVLFEGRVVERGGHDELVALGGRYAELFAAQAEGYREAGDAAVDGEGTAAAVGPGAVPRADAAARAGTAVRDGVTVRAGADARPPRVAAARAEGVR
ncbi:hypothetical protein ACFQ0M_08755 [Kitasatospora aburaviensis]